MLYRAQSTHRLKEGDEGIFKNPNIDRIRRPRDTNIDVHDAAGSWLQEKFNLNYRSLGVFCSGNIEIAKGYTTHGYSLISILPIGQYSLCYSLQSIDLFACFQFDPDAAKTVAGIRSKMEMLEFKKLENSGLEEAANSGCEIMLYAEYFSYRCL